jgi:flagellar hook-length control protein FliK
MQLTDIKGLGPLLTTTTGTALARSWTVGQILEAAVVARAVDNGTVKLRVGTNTFEARTDLLVKPGDVLQLKVENASQPVVLRALVPASTEQAVLQQALRAVLPRAGDIAPLFTQLAQLARAPAGAVPVPLAALARQLLDSTPEARTLTDAANLRAALQRSGVFLESSLARDGAPAPQDLKAALLALKTQLPADGSTANAPHAQLPESTTASLPALAKQVDAALARVELNQLQSTPPENRATAPLVIEVPVRDGDRTDVLRLQVDPEERAATGEAMSAWTVWLSFTPGDLGQVHCRLTVAGERVSANFWTERDTTAQLFQQHMSDLDAGLRRANLTPGRLDCQAGEPPRAPYPHLPSRLLDERA